MILFVSIDVLTLILERHQKKLKLPSTSPLLNKLTCKKKMFQHHILKKKEPSYSLLGFFHPNQMFTSAKRRRIVLLLDWSRSIDQCEDLALTK